MAVIDFDDFRREVYSVVGSIPRGKVLTYGQIAKLVGMPNHSRWVGRVLRNASSEGLPCHRVVNTRAARVRIGMNKSSCWRPKEWRLRPTGVLT